MEILYILKSQNDLSYKVGITNNMQKRLYSIEKDFGKIYYEESLIYSCENRKLLENIEKGIHAYLNNYYFSPEVIGGGSTEWFEIKSFEKCIFLVELFLKELPEIRNEGTLKSFLNEKVDFNNEFERINVSRKFLEIHSKTEEQVSSFIAKNINKISFEKRPGCYVFCNIDTSDLEINELPIFQWVRKNPTELIFDIKIYNEWKKCGIQKEVRGLIGIKFFNEFAFNNLDTFF